MVDLYGVSLLLILPELDSRNVLFTLVAGRDINIFRITKKL